MKQSLWSKPSWFIYSDRRKGVINQIIDEMEPIFASKVMYDSSIEDTGAYLNLGNIQNPSKEKDVRE